MSPCVSGLISVSFYLPVRHSSPCKIIKVHRVFFFVLFFFHFSFFKYSQAHRGPESDVSRDSQDCLSEHTIFKKKKKKKKEAVVGFGIYL